MIGVKTGGEVLLLSTHVEKNSFIGKMESFPSDIWVLQVVQDPQPCHIPAHSKGMMYGLTIDD